MTTRRIRTGNKRRKRALGKKIPKRLLGVWSGFIDSIDGNEVNTVVINSDNQKKYYATFPRRRFDHFIAPTSSELLLGTYFSLEIYNQSPWVIITPTLLSQEDIDRGRRNAEELIQLLSKLKVDE